MAGGRVDGKATLEKSLTVSYINILIYEPACLLLGSESLCLLKDMSTYTQEDMYVCTIAACV